MDPRYEGARVSRTQLSQAAEQRTEFSSESDLEDDDEEIASDASGDESEAPPSAPQSEEEDEDFLDQQAVADENSVAVSQDAAQAQPSLQGVRDADRTKGIAISHQTVRSCHPRFDISQSSSSSSVNMGFALRC